MSKAVKKGTYVTIYAWMLEMELSAAEMLVYAMIYGFCRNGGWYTGAMSYIMTWCRLSRRQTSNVLAGLVQKGHLQKSVRLVDGVRHCDYRAVIPSVGNPKGHKEEIISPSCDVIAKDGAVIARDVCADISGEDCAVSAYHNDPDDNDHLDRDGDTIPPSPFKWVMQ